MKKAFAEFFGTALVTTAVIGSAHMASISTKDGAVWLLVNMISTVTALYVAINLFAEISGAHFNPVVSLALLVSRKLTFQEFYIYIIAQLSGAVFGSLIAQAIFDRPLLPVSEINRNGVNLLGAEFIASFGLILIAIASWKVFEIHRRAALLSLWIASAYFFTSSTSFANPAVSLGRMFTDSLAGISPNSLLLFIPVQVLGGLVAFALNNYLSKERAIQR
jgi:glycerol uptake facilitator-like aquaporin